MRNFLKDYWRPFIVAFMFNAILCCVLVSVLDVIKTFVQDVHTVAESIKKGNNVN